MAVVAERFSGGAEQGQQCDREGIYQPQAVASVGSADVHLSHPHTETNILAVANPPLAFQRLRRRNLCQRRPHSIPQRFAYGIYRRYISSIILLKETAADEDKAAFLKKIVFERLNSGGVKLSPQETRNAVYGGPLNQLCLRLSENDWFRRMWGIPSQVGEISQDDDGGEGDSNDLDPPPGTSAGTRMFEKIEDVELILRFFAYRHIQKSNAGLNRISSFLDDFLRTGNRYPKSIPNDYERLLARTINFLFESCPATSGIDPSTTRGTDPPPFVFPHRQAMFLRSAEKGRFFIPAGLVDQAVELVAQGGQLQPVQHGNQMIMLAHQKPPPIAAS
jgi:hypothetical protein